MALTSIQDVQRRLRGLAQFPNAIPHLISFSRMFDGYHETLRATMQGARGELAEDALNAWQEVGNAFEELKRQISVAAVATRHYADSL